MDIGDPFSLKESAPENQITIVDLTGIMKKNFTN